MRRETLVLGLISMAVVAALAYGISFHLSPNVVDVGRGNANQVQQNSSVSTKLNELTEFMPTAPSEYADKKRTKESAWETNGGPVDEEIMRRVGRRYATRDILEGYSFLFERLSLSSQKQAALLEFLIDAQIAATWTPYQRGEPMTADERSNGIAAIIGSAKLQQFLKLERNVREYAEVQRLRSMLEQNGVPITDTQREQLFDVLVTTHSQFSEKTSPVDVESHSIEYLEFKMNQQMEYQRLVLELASSVLSAEQIRYLHEKFQARSYEWEAALEAQRQLRADTISENGLLWYPATD